MPYGSITKSEHCLYSAGDGNFPGHACADRARFVDSGNWRRPLRSSGRLRGLSSLLQLVGAVIAVLEHCTFCDGGSRATPRGVVASLILGLIVGSVFFFPNSNGFPSVNPLLAILTSTLLALFAWISARKVLQISQTKPMQDLSTLIGQRGRAKTPVEMEGSVQVAGELWSARSKDLIPRGSEVRVIGREGFVLIVENESS